MIRSIHSIAKFAACAALTFIVGAVSPALAADWPTRQINLMVPYPPGGSTDVVSRDLAEFLSRKLGQSTIVVNRPGASGTIGTNAVAKQDADGYNILMVQAGPINSYLTNKKLPYDPVKDFTYIIMFGRAPVVVSVTADSRSKRLPTSSRRRRKSPARSLTARPASERPRISAPRCLK